MPGLLPLPLVHSPTRGQGLCRCLLATWEFSATITLRSRGRGPVRNVRVEEPRSRFCGAGTLLSPKAPGMMKRGSAPRESGRFTCRLWERGVFHPSHGPTGFISWTIRKGGAGHWPLPPWSGQVITWVITPLAIQVSSSVSCVCGKVATAGLTWETPAGRNPILVEMDKAGCSQVTELRAVADKARVVCGRLCSL